MYIILFSWCKITKSKINNERISQIFPIIKAERPNITDFFNKKYNYLVFSLYLCIIISFCSYEDDFNCIAHFISAFSIDPTNICRVKTRIR